MQPSVGRLTRASRAQKEQQQQQQHPSRNSASMSATGGTGGATGGPQRKKRNRQRNGRGRGRPPPGLSGKRPPPGLSNVKSGGSSGAPSRQISQEEALLVTAPSIDDDNVCFICCEQCILYSAGSCEHPVCHVCSMRMRALCDDKKCLVCRNEMDTVLISNTEHGPWQKDHKQFPGIPEWGVYCVNEEVRKECNAGPFKSKELLFAHSSKVHSKQYCDICFDNQRKFPHEHRLFNRTELGRHRSKGDESLGNQNGHPACRFGSCVKRFYDNDALYEHLRDAHEHCTLCEKLGVSNQYFENYKALAQHYKSDHFICTAPECIEQHHIAFVDELELKAHIATVHFKDAKRSDARQARTLDASLFFNHGGVEADPTPQERERAFNGPPRGRSRGRGRGGNRGRRGGRGGRNDRSDRGNRSHGGEGESVVTPEDWGLPTQRVGVIDNAHLQGSTPSGPAVSQPAAPPPEPVVSAADFPSLGGGPAQPVTQQRAPRPQQPTRPAAPAVEQFPSLSRSTQGGKKQKQKGTRHKNNGAGQFSAAVGGPQVAPASAWTPAPSVRNYAATTSTAQSSGPAGPATMFSAEYQAPVATASYSQPPRFKERNTEVARSIKQKLGTEGFDTFKSTSAGFRKNSLPAADYVDACIKLFGPHMGTLFPEILALLPDIRKQHELADAFQDALDRESQGSVKSLNLSTKGRGPKLTLTRRGGASPLAQVSGQWLACSTCGQLLRSNDVAAHNAGHTGVGADAFPSLPARQARRSKKHTVSAGAWGS